MVSAKRKNVKQLVALIGRRVPLYLWAVSFTAGAVAGLGDFWKWGYEYGHHLDPRLPSRRGAGGVGSPPEEHDGGGR